VDTETFRLQEYSLGVALAYAATTSRLQTMTIDIPKTRAASPEAIARLRERYGHLPPDYVEFLGVHDGAKPPDNVLAGTGYNVGVRQFIPAEEIISTSEEVEGIAKYLMPIAEDGTGNFICMGAEDHKIYFWDHEVDDDQIVSPSFSDFLVGLEPFSLADLNLEPKVIRSWVDPNFKPKFK
jgi:hypothetical protein